MAQAISLSTHGGKKADCFAIGKRDEKHAVGTLREPSDEASFLRGGGHELRRLKQHERRFSEECSPKNDQSIGIACGGATRPAEVKKVAVMSSQNACARRGEALYGP